MTRRWAYGRGVPAWLALVVAATGCGGHGPPTHLVDGTPTQPPAVTLDTGRPQIATRVRVVDSEAAHRGRIGRCLAGASRRSEHGPIVERTAVDGSSITFRVTSSQDLIACDGTSPKREWCGRALGHVRGGRLLDPRLDIAGCSTPAGDRLAFAWVQPAKRTRFVAIRQDGYVEVYGVLGGLPLRVTTTEGIDTATSRGTFEVSEHDATGRRLRSYTLDARVAG